MLRQVSRTRVESSRKIELQLEEIHFLIETTFDSIRKVRNNNGLKAKVSLS